MTLNAGQRLAQYHLLEKLGEGGMGVVWKALDTRLDREVALKVPPPGMATDPDRRTRLEREAKAVAALNHPNIAAIHEIDEADGIAFIVMELVAGRTLREHVEDRPLQTDRLLDLAIQIADGLDAAHAKGIIHRDIKSANIIVNERGQAKILDFGLAKLIPQLRGAEGSGASEMETASAHGSLTSPGSTMGTVAYMSPEQVRGEDLDPRSDLFSFGAVLYEMATGTSAFSGNTFGVTYDAILNRSPASPVRLNPQVPHRLEEIIYKALEKNRGMRYQGAADLRTDLARLKRDRDSGRTSVVEGRAPSVATPADLDSAGKVAAHIARRHRTGLAVGLVLLAVLVAGFGYGLYRLFVPKSAPAVPGAIDSIAVLPFVNASGNAELEYLSDGITESLINRLSKLPDLRVVPRSLVFPYKGQPIDPSRVGTDLSVRGVVTGRVAQRGDTLFIGAEMMDVASVSQLWGQQYTRTMTDFFAVQEEIARDISRNLRLQLTPEDERKIGRQYTENTEAYKLYIKSLQHMSKGTKEEYQKAIDYAEQAIVEDLRQRGTVSGAGADGEQEDEDPGFALAYAALARMYTLQAFAGFVPPREVYPKAKAAALFALKMDDALADAPASLAFVRFFYEWDWPAAEREFERALELGEEDDEIHKEYSGYLMAMGREDEAILEMRRASELDALSDTHSALLAEQYFWAGRYAEALAEIEKTRVLSPDSGAARLVGAYVASGQGRHADAVAAYQEYLSLAGDEPLFSPTLAYFQARAGDLEEARRSLSRLGPGDLSPVQRAWIHAALGEIDRAFEWLEQAHEERAINLLWIKAQPWFDPLRPDPRFGDLLSRMNLPE